MIGTFDVYKAMTTGEYAAAYAKFLADEASVSGWQAYTDASSQVDSWLNGSGVKKFIDQVAVAKGIKVLLCTSKSQLNQREYKYDCKIKFDRIGLLDSNVYIRVDSSIDITADVMAPFWADLKTKL